MKNIHILPTDKPSKVAITDTNVLGMYKVEQITKYGVNQNIYITSDEEINQQTKPCWCINTIKNTWDADLIYYQGSMPQYHYVGFKKIILTTDQYLIKDGVQAIDDEFLEWFVKNPSCEEVEIRHLLKSIFDPKTNEKYPIVQHNHFDLTKMICKYHYELIIPKEEPKKKHIVMLVGDKVNEEPKQETFEEVTDKASILEFPIKEWCRSDDYNREEITAARDGFKRGAKWQIDKQDNFIIGFLEFIEGTYSYSNIFDYWYLHADTSKTYTKKELLKVYQKYIDTLNIN